MKTKYENQIVLYRRSIPSWDDADYCVDESREPAIVAAIKTTATVVAAPVKGAFLVLNFVADLFRDKEL
jgi:hypothetical protein